MPIPTRTAARSSSIRRSSPSQQTITLGATLVLSETAGPEVIDGPGAGLVTVSGGGAVSVFEVDSGVTASLSGLTISGGSTAGNGGGLYNYGTTTLTNCTVSGNSAAESGGGLWNGGSGPATLTLADCTISGNSAFEVRRPVQYQLGHRDDGRSPAARSAATPPAAMAAAA